MTNTTPQAAEAARLAEEANVLIGIVTSRQAEATYACTSGHGATFDFSRLRQSESDLRVAIDRLRDLASRADSPVGEAADLGPVYIPDDQGPEDVRYVREDRALAAIAAASKPAAAEVTGEAPPSARRLVSALVHAACLQEREPSEANQNSYRAVRDAVEAALAPSEAQKAVAWPDLLELAHALADAGRNGRGGLHDDLVEEAYERLRLALTHPSAGAGVPQEVAMAEADVDALMVLADEYAAWKAAHEEHATPGSLSHMTAAREALRAAAWGIRLKGEA